MEALLIVLFMTASVVLGIAVVEVTFRLLDRLKQAVNP